MKLEDVLDYLKLQPLMYLATVDENQPRVRPMALIYHNDTCWFVSIAGREKINEIKKNNKVEFTINPQDREDLSTIRGTGKVILITNFETKKGVIKAIPWFDGYWKSYDDPMFYLYRLDLEKISVQIPVKRDIYIFDLKTGDVKIKEE